MDFIVTVTVQQHQIGGQVVVVVAVPVVNFEQVFCHEVQSAKQAAAFLFFQQSYYPFGFGRVSSQAVYPVGPIPIVGAFCPLYLDMPFDGCVCVFDEGGFSIRKVEAVTLARPVALLAPVATFVGVLPFSPFR